MRAHSTSRLKQLLYREPMRQVCISMRPTALLESPTIRSTRFSQDVHAGRGERDVVHYYGLDRAPFESVAADRARFRRQWDLPEDAL